MKLDGIGVILAALLVAAFVGWLLNTVLPHLWLGYVFSR